MCLYVKSRKLTLPRRRNSNNPPNEIQIYWSRYQGKQVFFAYLFNRDTMRGFYFRGLQDQRGKPSRRGWFRSSPELFKTVEVLRSVLTKTFGDDVLVSQLVRETGLP